MAAAAPAALVLMVSDCMCGDRQEAVPVINRKNNLAATGL